MILLRLFSAMLVVTAISSRADEGMWLFNKPPLKQLKEKYQFQPTPQSMTSPLDSPFAMKKSKTSPVSGLGLQNTANLRILRELITEVPLIVDAGVGTASDATVAMELGFDGVLMNTAIAQAKDPLLMAEAMQHAVLAGRQAYLAGRMPRKLYATASSPLEGISR